MNRVWRVGAGGRSTPIPSTRRGGARQGGELQQPGAPQEFPPGTEVAVTVKVGRAKRAKDIDNLNKALLDLLQALRVIGKDRDVSKLTIERDTAIEDGRVQVFPHRRDWKGCGMNYPQVAPQGLPP